jgi:hypothetical protein
VLGREPSGAERGGGDHGLEFALILVAEPGAGVGVGQDVPRGVGVGASRVDDGGAQAAGERIVPGGCEVERGQADSDPEECGRRLGRLRDQVERLMEGAV